jgi:4-oxalomesaconate tautomerase
MLMRGGTSKGAYFVGDDLPSDPVERDDLLLRIMGSPDIRQIDGIGGGHPLTSKVAVISRSQFEGADVDYLFLQIAVDQPLVSDSQTCGNLLAGVGPFALERGLVEPNDDETRVRIRIMNGAPTISVATVRTRDGRVRYDGDTLIPGVPFPSSPVFLSFAPADTPLFPTGRVSELIDGIEATCIDGGMPVVIVRAGAVGIVGDEIPAQLEADGSLRELIERIRLAAGLLMGLGDVAEKTVPKVSIVSDARAGGLLSTRTFIPHRVHTSIGVMGAVSVAAAAAVEGTTAFRSRAQPGGTQFIEHPSGSFALVVRVAGSGAGSTIVESAVVRSARKLFDGQVWPR